MAAWKGLESLNHNFLTGKLEDFVQVVPAHESMWPATFGLACCAIEMMAAGAADYDLARFGMEVFRPSPRQADLMIVAGRVSQKMAPVLRQVYDQMVEPKWVISMGVCASTGGMFNNYAIVQGVDEIVPVDVYAPGCPPSPQTLIHAILTLHEKVRPARSPSGAARRDGGAGIDLAAEVPAGRSRSRRRCASGRLGDDRRLDGDRGAPSSSPRTSGARSGIPIASRGQAGAPSVTRERYLEVVERLSRGAAS